MDLIELKPSELALALEDCFASDVIPCTLSKPGMAKSDIHRQVAAKIGMRLVDERSSMMDTVDWRGVPDIDRENKRTTWYPPLFLPGPKDKPSIVFIDEITQTPEACQAPLLQLFLDRRIGTVYQAPKSTRFACAGNMLNDGTFSRKLGGALRNRMLFLYLKPDLDEWCKWAYNNDVDPSVIAYLRYRPENLYKYDPNEMSSATLRSWERVSDIVKKSKNNGRIADALISGLVGTGIMMEFMGFRRVWAKCPPPDSVIMNPDTATVPNEPELKYAMANALAIKMTVNNIDKISIYLQRMPAEYHAYSLKMAIRRDERLANTNTYTRYCVEHAEMMS